MRQPEQNEPPHRNRFSPHLRRTFAVLSLRFSPRRDSIKR
jgi:hypothetical protein